MDNKINPTNENTPLPEQGREDKDALRRQALDDLKQTAGTIADKAATTLDEFTDKAADKLDDAYTTAGVKALDLSDKAADLGDKVADKLDDAYTTAGVKAMDLGEKASDFGEKAAAKIDDAYTTAGVKAMDLGEKAADKLDDAYTTAGVKAMDFGEKAADKLDDAYTTVGVKAMDLRDKAADKIDDVYTTVGVKAMDLSDQAKDTVERLRLSAETRAAVVADVKKLVMKDLESEDAFLGPDPGLQEYFTNLVTPSFAAKVEDAFNYDEATAGIDVTFHEDTGLVDIQANVLGAFGGDYPAAIDRLSDRLAAEINERMGFHLADFHVTVTDVMSGAEYAEVKEKIQGRIAAKEEARQAAAEKEKDKDMRRAEAEAKKAEEAE